MKKPMIDRMKRGPYDELYTPREAVIPLIKYITPPKIIWEPCDHGESNITSELSWAGNFVQSTHPKDGFDFLTDKEEPEEFDIIVTNPPYSLKDKFIKRCIEYQKPFALLLPLDSFGGVRRGKMFRKLDDLTVIVIDKRPDFTGKGKPWFYVAWFTHGLGLDKNLIFAKANE